MNIIKSDIIKETWDSYWNDAPTAIACATPRPVLVISRPYDQESAEETQLIKMLEACKLMPEQYNIISVGEKEEIAWYQIREKLIPSFILLIGVYPAQLGISALFCLHEANNFNDRVWLPTLSIEELEKNKDVKKHLWLRGLQPIFIKKEFGDIR